MFQPKSLYNQRMAIKRSFSLIPFPAPVLPEITVTGTIAHQNGVLTLHYSLNGNLEELFLPSPSAHPCRKDELWKTTCFEFFLAIKGQPQYWEFNMSPSGDWNVYCMEAYRRIGFQEETSIQRLHVQAREEADTFHLDTAVDPTPILHTDQRLEIGITAIVQTRNGSETYWALSHPAPYADFHLRESFLCSI